MRKTILANFQGEEEWEAFTDNDVLADEPAPKCFLFFYIRTWDIIDEA